MGRRAFILLMILAAVVALPLLLRRDTRMADGSAADDRVVIVTPHNDSIRKEFGEAFADYWHGRTGRTVFVDWRAPGGGGDIKRLVDAAFSAADDLGKEGTEYDVFFGGGTKDFIRQAESGHLADLEVFEEHPEWFGPGCIPAEFSGEPYHDPAKRWVGVCVSQFGIVVNLDSLARAGMPAPQRWRDLGDPSYFGQLALADPTKSSSITQAMEMVVQAQMQEVIGSKGDTPSTRAEGWKRGLNLLQRMAANARYFTDSSSKIPHDVASGNATAGTAIDFYGRAFEDAVRDGSGRTRLRWLAPAGGTSLSVDPIAVFKGAPHMELAQEFVVFCLSERGQLLWNSKPGAPSGPDERGLRRLPVRRDMYTPERLRNFTDPDALPYERTGNFIYQPELTGPAFDALRVIFRAMCMDPHEELKAAWKATAVEGRGESEAMFEIPPVSYEEVRERWVPMLGRGDGLEIARATNDLARFFRERYRRVARGGRSDG